MLHPRCVCSWSNCCPNPGIKHSDGFSCAKLRRGSAAVGLLRGAGLRGASLAAPRGQWDVGTGTALGTKAGTSPAVPSTLSLGAADRAAAGAAGGGHAADHPWEEPGPPLQRRAGRRQDRQRAVRAAAPPIRRLRGVSVVQPEGPCPCPCPPIPVAHPFCLACWVPGQEHRWVLPGHPAGGGGRGLSPLLRRGGTAANHPLPSAGSCAGPERLWRHFRTW